MARMDSDARVGLRRRILTLAAWHAEQVSGLVAEGHPDNLVDLVEHRQAAEDLRAVAPHPTTVFELRSEDPGATCLVGLYALVLLGRIADARRLFDSLVREAVAVTTPRQFEIAEAAIAAHEAMRLTQFRGGQLDR
ncbi:hypothetical protein ACN2C7_11025 [Caulobacter sp. ErkDOM-E]|uniref:hypothetical protein n=1 Tax=Caulobacter sp. ErkDOM-E TaxID=3402778 RepID=UPI003AF45EC6